MFEFLARLREKPEEHRRNVAIAASGVVTAFIAMLWLSTLTLGSPSQTTAAVSAPSPFAAVGAAFDNFFSDEKPVQETPGVNILPSY